MNRYFDANATYGVEGLLFEEVKSKCQGALNPSSIYKDGQRARLLIEESREEVGLLIGADRNDKIIFTLGVTEFNNAAIFGASYYYLKIFKSVTRLIEKR